MNLIREATVDDYQNICTLISSEEELFLVHPNGKYPLSLEQLVELAKTRVELSVLISDREIIGFANFYNFKIGKSTFIGNMIIDTRFRNRGMGRKLVIHMIDVAFEKHQLPQVSISVFSENTKALLLYNSLGFSAYDIEERKNFKGERVALIHLTKINPN